MSTGETELLAVSVSMAPAPGFIQRSENRYRAAPPLVAGSPFLTRCPGSHPSADPVKRLGQVIDGPRRLPLLPVLLAIEGRQHDDRNLRVGLSPLSRRATSNPSKSGSITSRTISAVNRPGLFHGLGAIEGTLVLESSDLNVSPYQLIDFRIIFDDEHGPSIFRH